MHSFLWNGKQNFEAENLKPAKTEDKTLLMPKSQSVCKNFPLLVRHQTLTYSLAATLLGHKIKYS